MPKFALADPYLPATPPVVLKFDASSLPVCLITLQGKGQVRNQGANVKGASVPQPFGGTYRQMRYGGGVVTHLAPATTAHRTGYRFCSGMNIPPKDTAIGEHESAGGY
jgi:hypothetical protein